MEDPSVQSLPDLTLAVQAYEGGLESMLAAHDLIQMYQRYAFRRGWRFASGEVDAPAPGQIRRATVAVTGAGAVSRLRHEYGVHRIQRLGMQLPLRRTHTATVIVRIIQALELAEGSETTGTDDGDSGPTIIELPKIRTYNYMQNRVTDHRIGRNFPGLPLLLDGDLDSLIDALDQGSHTNE